ncbi:MAG: prephenate dehydratase [Clostridiales bacterium]|jgi:prephenate dehydratase|nr:prephenate dehydratase [Clostridiales bacterium]
MTIAYLGPRGTFTQQAADLYAKGAGAVFDPRPTIDDVIADVDSGKTELGVVPIENSTEGTVNVSLDKLIFGAEVYIEAQLTLPVSQNMFVRPENAGKPVEKIISHPQALAQCREFISANYGAAELIPAASTAKAAEEVSRSGGSIAAVGNSLAGELYGLLTLHENIQDDAGNATIFAVLTKRDTSAPKDGFNTSVAFGVKNRPGELYRVLDIFAIWDINMTKILSRPMPGKTGEYVFFTDLSGERGDLESALEMVKRKAGFLKTLGSYPVVNL